MGERSEGESIRQSKSLHNTGQAFPLVGKKAAAFPIKPNN